MREEGVPQSWTQDGLSRRAVTGQSLMEMETGAPAFPFCKLHLIKRKRHAVSTPLVTVCRSYLTDEPQRGAAVPGPSATVAVTMRSDGRLPVVRRQRGLGRWVKP